MNFFLKPGFQPTRPLLPVTCGEPVVVYRPEARPSCIRMISKKKYTCGREYHANISADSNANGIYKFLSPIACKIAVIIPDATCLISYVPGNFILS